MQNYVCTQLLLWYYGNSSNKLGHILYFLMGKPVYIKKLINSLYIKNCDIKIWNSFDDLQKKIRKQFPNENLKK